MEIRLLGPIEVATPDGIVALGPPRQRAVLAMLALAAGEVVSTDRLVDGLWAEAPPNNPLAALQVFIHGLRKTLRGATGQELVSRDAPGYRLTVGPGATDVARFLDLHRQAREARTAGRMGDARDRLEEAERLWRGPALADVLSAPFAQAEAVRLDELRLSAQEDAYDVRLALGEHAAVVDPLARAVDDHPMRERFWGQLMTALYRSERQGEALAAYSRARDQLADELGIDPGSALQALELAILRQDPAISAPQPGRTAPVASRARTRVPVPATPTFGRDQLVAEVVTLLRRPDVRHVCLTGPGGSGKSRVAALVANDVAEAVAGAVVYLPVTERTEPAQLVTEASLALTGTDDADALTDFEGPGLIVLDNLESLASPGSLVSDLVARTRDVTVLATSRVPMRIRAEHDIAVPPLDVPGQAASADETATSPSVQMFLERAEAASPGFDGAAHLADVADLCRFLDGFPLAIELAAAQVRLLPPAKIRAALDHDLALLATRNVDVPERQQTLTATIAWSYDRLGDAARSVLGRLAIFERGFTVEAVEAICGDVPDVLDALAELVEARLVRNVAARVEIRFAVAGTVRAFARGRLDPAESDALRAALGQHLLGRVRGWGSQVDGPDGATVIGRFDDTAADLDALLEWAVRTQRGDLATELVEHSTELWIASGRMTEGRRRTAALLDLDLAQSDRAAAKLAAAKLDYHLTRFEASIEAARAALACSGGRPATRVSARAYLGAALLVTGSGDEGRALAAQALDEGESLGLYAVSVFALSALAIASALSGDLEQEKVYYEQRLRAVTERGDVARVADTLNTLAEIALDDADGELATAYAEESVGIAGGVLLLEARDAHITLARAAVVLGDPVAAARHLAHARELVDRTGQSFALAQWLRAGGCLAAVLGRSALAVQVFAAAQTASASPSGTDEPIEVDFNERLAACRDALGEAAASRAWTLGRTLPITTTRHKLEALLQEVEAGGG
ncbi:AfsR/SARP family transcriptional regulator [Nocardioides rubriscoriae]|uniref:AfsR/SARP family transcriptional regulator n=1 Tax=Nocardioides rubriscoriae TaxID=642762 RepID=UPI0011DF8F39|nr:BTAD domain-containing putative transcriptional regulator [Nocardioides rubriscoriae]